MHGIASHLRALATTGPLHGDQMDGSVAKAASPNSHFRP
jgi:hypothetical protein